MTTQPTTPVSRLVRVDRLLECFARQEQVQKKAGGFAHAEGVRWCITNMLRIADEGEPPIDNTGDDS